ncbi:hypothetical protein [Paenibacillus sp. KN14-4R]|uniref:hypothetical protein n=1 Tax=Paenibacillus sp. KN14-4R TaxID=3445773 RepID=UPI003F9FC2D2
MAKKRILKLIVLFIIGIFSVVYIARKDAISIATKGQGKGNYVVTKMDVVWFKMSPYWSITLEGNGTKRTILVDPFYREVFAESGA